MELLLDNISKRILKIKAFVNSLIIRDIRIIFEQKKKNVWQCDVTILKKKMENLNYQLQNLF